MKTLILTVDDIRAIVRQITLDGLMDELIARLQRAIEGFDPHKTVVPIRSGFHYHRPAVGLLEWMPILELGGPATIKIVGYHPSNPQREQLPTILSTVSAFDSANGHLIGLADATFLTALRTGAASAVASRALAVEDSRTLGLVGGGAQAVTQLHALERVFDLETVLVYDSNPAVAASFRERAAFSGAAIRQAPLDAIMRESDILCTATSVDIGKGPVLPEGVETRPWLHINAVGSDFPGKVELPRSLLTASFVCPDFHDQAVNEGECQQLDPDEIHAELVTVIQNPVDFPDLRNRRTVFDSTGWALEDQVAFQMLIDCAADLGLGTPVDLESMSDDPHNPYAFLNPAGTPATVDELAASNA